MNTDPSQMPAPPMGGGPVLERWLVLLAMVALILVAAGRLVGTFSAGNFAEFGLIAASILLVLWTFLARDAWWIMLPLAIGFGGFFYFGFKLLLTEVGLVLCLLPLGVTIAASTRLARLRSPVPTSAVLLLLYLTGHMVFSLYLAQSENMPGIIHIVRVYAQGLWPLIFLVAFHPFGKTTVLRAAFVGMYITSLLRIGLGATSFFFPAFSYIPGLNFVLPSSSLGPVDLRASASIFTALNLCYVSMSKSNLRTAFHVLMIVATGVATLLSSGRGAFLVFCTVPLLLSLLRGKLAMLGLMCLALVVAAVIVNRDPTVLFRFPDPVRRTLSVLVVDSPRHDVLRDVESSNEWHFQLARMGRDNWLKTPLSFALGNRIYPFSEDFFARSANFEAKMDIAARMGSYESGLWTILGVLGFAGFLLYAVLLLQLLKGMPRAIRRDGIHDYAHAFYFVALSSAGIWALFCWIAGHFPSDVVMYAAIARAAYEDRKAREQTPRDAAPP